MIGTSMRFRACALLHAVIVGVAVTASAAEPTEVGRAPITTVWHVDEERAELYVRPMTNPSQSQDGSFDVVVLDAWTLEEKRRVRSPLKWVDTVEAIVVDPRQRMWLLVDVPEDEWGESFTTRVVAVDAFDGSGGAVVADLVIAERASGMLADPVHPRIYVTHFSSGLISVLNAHTGAREAVIDLGSLSCPTAMAIDPARDRLYVMGCRQVLFVIDTATLEATHHDPVGVNSYSIAVGPNGKVYVASWEDRTLAVLDRDLSLVASMNTGGNPTSLTVSSSTGRAYVTIASNDWYQGEPGNESQLLAIDADTNQVVSTMPTPGDAIVTSFGPGYRLIAANAYGGNNREAKVLTEDAVAPAATIHGEPTQIVQPGELLTGEAHDDLSGIASVAVTLQSVSVLEPQLILDCDDSRRACTWTLPAPDLPGVYLLNVAARDRAGNDELLGSVAVVIVAQA